MHLGGNLVGNPLKYEGGTVINWGIDPDVVSHGDLCKMVEDAGYRDVKALYYLKPVRPHFYCQQQVLKLMMGYNRNNTVDEGKDASESHVIDEGLSNINNGVGPSEVNSEERVEANINEVDEGLSPTVERDQEALREQEEQRDSLDLRNYGSDDEEEVVCKNSKKDYFDPSDKVPSFQLGMIFENSKQFKAATKYAIAKRFDFKLSKNDQDKTRAVCKGQDCPSTIYASIDSRDEHYKSNEGNTSESIAQAHVHSAVEDNVFDVPLTCSISIPDVPSSRTTTPTPPAPHVPTEEPPTRHFSTKPIIPPAPTEEPPTLHCSTEPYIPPASTSVAAHHASTAHVPSNKKGKEKVLGQFPKPTTRGRKIMEDMGVYVNYNTSLEILNPGLEGQKILSYSRTRSQNAPSSN
ncbi:hypothetical protein V6N11_042774 [Hibiscus sabdariffa]|uniref:Transposase MuDR plant domain-containing protein n=1 Tax=Hibiscus sabdariffa TaxID=183260 RepID=A0ABR2QXC7_9ROSI